MVLGDSLIASLSGVGYVALRLGVVLLGLCVVTAVVVWLWPRR